MEQIKGIVQRLLRRDEETGNVFALIRFESPTGLVDAKMSANARELAEGDFFVAEGVWNSKSFRGRTEEVFAARNIRPDLPETPEGAARWFSTIFNARDHGVTPASVKDFVAGIGANAARICESQPERIVGISAEPAKFRNAVLRDWGQRIAGRRAVDLLEKSGIDNKAISSVIDAFRDTAFDVLSKNPYSAARVPDFGFAGADLVGTGIGIAGTDDRRVGAAFVEAVVQARREGHTFATLQRVGETLKEQFGIPVAVARDFAVRHLDSKDAPFRLDAIGDRLVAMLPELFAAEAVVARGVVGMLANGRRNPEAIARRAVDAVFAQDKFKQFDEIQRAGVLMAAMHPVSILTGGPGTGKSTVTEAIVAAASAIEDGPLLVCAPTGKAAQRVEEASGRPATTLHLLLQARMDPLTGSSVFGRNKQNPIPAKAFVVVDEASMIDVETMRALIEAMPPDGRLLLVGDRNQLSSVDAGAVLGDLLSACMPDGTPVVPRTELINVYRQSRDSRIAVGAAEIRQGIVPELSDKMDGGLIMYPHATSQIVERIRWIANFLISKRYRAEHVAVLSPQAPGPGGTWEINRVMSELFNPKGRPIPGVAKGPNDDKGLPVPRIGDRVMLTENDNENKVMNGDVGTIVAAFPKASGSGDRPHFQVEFDSGSKMDYPAALWRRFILAYAITIHKSQGSQYPVVIMPVSSAHERMLDRSILYTGWTRAKKMLFLVGEPEALESAIGNTESSRRSTRLAEFIARAAADFGYMPVQPATVAVAPAPAASPPAPIPAPSAAVQARAPAPAVGPAPAAPALPGMGGFRRPVPRRPQAAVVPEHKPGF